MSDPIKAWHFVAENGKLRDGTPLEVGRTYRIEGEPVLCVRGLHASTRILDALKYAPGPIVCRVRMGGKIIHDTDKLVATERVALWSLDATRLLHGFACDIATLALAKVGVDDPRCHAAIAVKRRWLDGKATDQELSDARVAAGDAASASASAAAWGDAAWDAARAAASAAASAAANVELERRILEERGMP